MKTVGEFIEKSPMNIPDSVKQNQNIQQQNQTAVVISSSIFLDEENICKICMDSVIECVFVDCGHMICCMNCSSSLNVCPFCRKTIIKAIKFFK